MTIKLSYDAIYCAARFLEHAALDVRHRPHKRKHLSDTSLALFALLRDGGAIEVEGKDAPAQ